MSLVLFGLFFLGRISIPAAVATQVILTILCFGYPVYFLTRWGQTLGRMVARIKVVAIDGSSVTAGMAWRRSSVEILFWLVYLGAYFWILATWQGPEWSSMSWVAQGRAMSERSVLVDAYRWSSQIWLCISLATMFFNARRRTLNDFIGGTVVVKVDDHAQARSRTAIAPIRRIGGQ